MPVLDLSPAMLRPDKAPGRDPRLAIFAKPVTPDPFVNAAMTSLGQDERGVEQFWISSVNSLCGATSLLLDEAGECRRFDWPGDRSIRAIYSVAVADADTLWLAGGSLGHFIRLDLPSGDFEMFPMPAGRFVTAGMALDPHSGKLFCGAQTALLSFDTSTRSCVRVYGESERPPDNHHYDHWMLPDGTFGFVLSTPGLSYLRWDPAAESVTWTRLIADQHHPAVESVRHLKYTDGQRVYLPHLGWLDGLTGTLSPHRHPPDQEACWLGVDRGQVVGASGDRAAESVTLIRWDPESGCTRKLCTVPDTNALNLALTCSGKVVVVDLYGRFQRYDAVTGELEVTRQVGGANEHRCNVIIPAGPDRVVGAPFISQNFWVADLRAGSGQCLGRAGGSFGQVDYAVAAGGRIYFAIYGGGQLSEYDPEVPSGFPRNPCVVARTDQGQHGAGITTDDTVVWAAFRPRYGTLDGAMLRYDTSTGAAASLSGAVPRQHVLNPVYDAAMGQLVAGTCCLPDCETATPVHDTAWMVQLNPSTMEVVGRCAAPAGIDTAINFGPLGQGRWLCRCAEDLMVFDAAAESLEALPAAAAPPSPLQSAEYAGTPGVFVVQAGEELLLWNAQSGATRLLARVDGSFVSRWWVHGTDLTFDCGRHAAVLRGVVTPL